MGHVVEALAESVDETAFGAAGNGGSGGGRHWRIGRSYKVAVRMSDDLNARATCHGVEGLTTGYGHGAAGQRHRMARVTIGDGDGARFVGCHAQAARRVWYVELDLTIGHDGSASGRAGRRRIRRCDRASRRRAATDRRTVRYRLGGRHRGLRRRSAIGRLAVRYRVTFEIDRSSGTII